MMRIRFDGVGEVAVVQDEAAVRLVRVLVEVVDALGVEGRGAALDAVDLVALGEQELGEVGAVLAGDAGDQSLFHLSSCSLDSWAPARRLRSASTIFFATPAILVPAFQPRVSIARRGLAAIDGTSVGRSNAGSDFT